MIVHCFPTREDVARAAVEDFLTRARQAIAERGVFHVALSGGSTPKAVYRLLAKEPDFTREIVEKTHVYFGDERSVPQDDKSSNVRLAVEHLLKPLNFPAENIHAPDGAADDLGDEAYRYERRLLAAMPEGDSGDPIFDLVWLGMGPDGHTASLFPGTEAVEVPNRIYVENYVAQLDTWRLTLTADTINAARAIVVLITGEEKAPVLGEIFDPANTAQKYPIQSIKGTGGNLLFLIDEEAAAEVKPEAREALFAN